MWYCIGATLVHHSYSTWMVVNWYRVALPWTTWALYRYSIGIALVLHWYCPATSLALPWYETCIALAH